MKFSIKELAKRLTTFRGVVKELGVCDICGDEEADSIKTQILRISMVWRDGEPCDINFCNLCEGLLLQRLLKSYVKRMETRVSRRDKKMGFKGEIPVDLPGEEEGDEGILSLIEQRQQKLLAGTAEPPSWDVGEGEKK